MRKISSEGQLVAALRGCGLDAEIVATRFEAGSLVVLFTVDGHAGRRVALTAYITTATDKPSGALEARPRIDIYTGFIDREAGNVDRMGSVQDSWA